MAKNKGTFKLGLFILIGIIIFSGVVYFMAEQRHLLEPTFEVKAIFETASGLQEGNNVRYTGIDVGIVEDISIISDTAVMVTMRINEDAGQFIKKDAEVIIASLGLMGNKYVNITPGSTHGRPIEDGDILATRRPVDIEDVLQELQTTGAYTSEFMSNLVEVSQQIRDGVGIVGRLLTDTALASSMEQSIRDLSKINAVIEEFRLTGVQAREMATDLAIIMERMREGQGLAGKLMGDTAWVQQFESVMDSLESISTKATLFADDLQVISSKLRAGEGTAGKLLTDTTTSQNIDMTLIEMQQAAREFQETMNQLQNGWLFRFVGGKKKEKKE